MTLLRPPRRPAASARFRVTVGVRAMPASWHDYVYWNVALDED
jgi:hypothetical protein